MAEIESFKKVLHSTIPSIRLKRISNYKTISNDILYSIKCVKNKKLIQPCKSPKCVQRLQQKHKNLMTLVQ